MASSRAKALSALSPLLFLGAGLLVGAAAPTFEAESSGMHGALADRDGSPEVRDQKFFGNRCTRRSTEVAGGTIVGAGGQAVAAGAGTGIGCGTFYAYELRPGQPTLVLPYVEPGVFLNPGEEVGPPPG